MFKFQKISFVAAFFLSVFLAPAGQSWAAAESHCTDQDDTLLMFVGENIDVLSIASRRQESAWKAPAVAQVVTREELWDKGVRTLSQSLEMIPGFYMAQKEWGTEPYLRGIPDSVLFLYDTVPMGSDVTKSLNPIDHELSLASVKRIEIIRGPGSVLWGPDAFAGIVNIVPMTGKDLDGVETGMLYGAPGDQGALYVNMGHNAGPWDVFLSLSGRNGEEDNTTCNIVRFWGDGNRAYPYGERFGDEKPGRSRYFEASGNFSFRDVLTVSALIFDYKKPYAITGPKNEKNKEDLTWWESRSAPYGFVKLESKKDLDPSSAIRFTGSYSWVNPEYEIIDKTFDQSERTIYAELIYDRSFFSGRGLITGGLSYRNKRIKDALIWKSYFPDYVAQQKTRFLPLFTEEDYDTNLWSIFGQYTHKIGDFDLLLGLRNDNHDEYKDHLSYNTSVVWTPWSQWIFKAMYGTAYRTPFARQLLGDEEPELENIRTLNIQAGWKPSDRAGVSVCGFFSKIQNHLMEDPYAGLSKPNHQNINGVEIAGNLSPFKGLDFSANLTLSNNSGPDETYHYLKYVWPEPQYEDLNFPYDAGPHTLFNLMGTWRPVEKVTVFARLGYHSSTQLIYPRSDTFVSIPGVWLLDMSTTVRDVVFSGLELQVSVRNLTNNHYETPGTYSAIRGKPLSAEVVLRKTW